MKILFCSDSLGGPDRALLKGFGSSGHEIAVATFYQSTDELPEFVQPFRTFHETFTAYPHGLRISGWRLKRAFTYLREERRAISTLRRWVDEWKPDVVFAIWAVTMGYVAAKARLPNLVVCPTGSDILLMPMWRRWYRRRVKEALQGADMWIFDAEHTALRAKELAPGNTPWHAIPCYHDPNEWGVGMADRAFFEEKWPGRKIVLSSRTMNPLYDPSTMIRAMEKVDAVLYIAGEGYLRKDMEKIAGENVHFAGRISHAELAGKLAACDAYVSTSTSDSLSVGVLEAMSCERPVVASDIPGNRNCVQDGISGRLFRTGDPDDLADKLRGVLENPGDMGKRGREWVLEHADGKNNFPRLIAAFESLVGLTT